MQALLEDMNSLPGVVGSLFCDAKQGVLCRSFPPSFEDTALSAVAAALSAATPELRGVTGAFGVLDMRYREARVVVRPAVDVQEVLQVGDGALVVGDDPRGAGTCPAYGRVIVRPYFRLELLGEHEVDEIVDRDYRRRPSDQWRVQREKMHEIEPFAMHGDRQRDLLAPTKVSPARERDVRKLRRDARQPRGQFASVCLHADRHLRRRARIQPDAGRAYRIGFRSAFHATTAGYIADLYATYVPRTPSRNPPLPTISHQKRSTPANQLRANVSTEPRIPPASVVVYRSYFARYDA
jgi:hypothetical protein